MRLLDAIGPSGSISSSINDMSKWLKLQLGNGKFADKQLVSKRQLRKTWRNQITFQPDVDYGLGWMIRDWKGKRVIEHGGNVPVFGLDLTQLAYRYAGQDIQLTDVHGNVLKGITV